MRKRLYQTIPEDSNLIDTVNSATQERKKKRLYAEKENQDHPNTGKIVPELEQPFSQMFSLAAKQLDALYALSQCYVTECAKLPVTLYSNWYNSTQTASNLINLYLRNRQSTWEKNSLSKPGKSGSKANTGE